jgi:adhesin/invasin
VIQTHRRFAFPIGLLLAALLAGCGGDVVLPDEGEAASLEIVSGDEQLGPAGTTLAQQVVVRVLDTRGRPVANQDVTFTIGSGGGTVAPTTVKSDAAGQAAAAWTLGPNAGSHLLRVQTPRGGSGTLEVTVRATAVAGSGSVLVEAGGDEQTGPVNSALADSLVVQATDALGNPVASVEVTWSVSGGGSISPVTVVTGADGLAAAERVLGPSAGAQSAQATVAGFTGSPVTFSHTAIPANPTALVKISGDGQTAPGGFEVAEDLVVRLEDDNGNGIGSRAITWVVPAGSGSVNPVNTTTDANGLATTRWTLPTAVGNYAVSAVFSGLPAVPFTGTATADVPTTIALVSGNNQSAAVGAALANPLVVRVTDANGIPVGNVGVTWTAEVGGSVSAENTATDASGLAQVTRTLGLLPGTYTTTAAVDGLNGSPITFTSTATVGPAAKLAIITQPGTTTATSGIALVPQPEIEVQDALGNPILVAGRTVSASITSSPEDPTGPGSANISSASDQTNSSGRTTYTNLRISGPAGSYVLTFSSGALIPVSSATFTLGAGGASRLVIQQQPATTAVNGAVITPAPIVRVEDAAGNPVAGNRNILVDIESGPGVLSGTTTVGTGGGSTATFSNLRITGEVGPRTLLFSSSGLTSVESAEIDITAGPATSMAIQAGGGTQTAGVGEDVPTPPAVILTDQSGNPVSGVSVAFEVTEGDGSVDPGTVVTGADGIAAVTRWTLGPSAGSNTLEASVPSAPALGTETFNADGTVANSAPTAQSDNNPAYTVDEDGTLNITTLENRVLFNDTDPDGDNLTAVNASNPAGGTVTLSSNGSFNYTPDPDFNGPDSFTYQANDGLANSNTATVSITVTPVNDPPGFQSGPNQVVSASDGAVSVAGWATGIVPGPTNESSQTVSFQVSTNNDAAFAALPVVEPSGTLNYTPQTTLSQIDASVTVEALDSGGATSDPQVFTITIDP